MIKKSGNLQGGRDHSSDSVQVFNSLRSYAKHRIINDMIETARRHALSKDYLIMILD